MAMGKDLKLITETRIKSAKFLYKAVICKTLNLNTYLDFDGMGDKVKIFKIHSFNSLLTLSGMEQDFTLNRSKLRF